VTGNARICALSALDYKAILFETVVCVSKMFENSLQQFAFYFLTKVSFVECVFNALSADCSEFGCYYQCS